MTASLLGKRRWTRYKKSRQCWTMSIPSLPLVGHYVSFNATRILCKKKKKTDRNVVDGNGQIPADETLYNFDDTFGQSAHDAYPLAKKVRSNDAPLLGRRFNSLSQKWKTRTGAGPMLSVDTVRSNPTRSREGSAGSTVLSPAVSVVAQHESLLPPSPARTMFEESIQEVTVSPIDIEKANSYPILEETPQARTPLLPPVMTALSSQKHSPVQSPLQSPTIADSGLLPDSTTPTDTPRMSSLPSPPLSTKPSIASLRQRSRAGTMIASADIPPMIIDAEGEDAWSTKLGHADFTIFPEPYLPQIFCAETLQQFCEDYEQARTHFAKHLARTGENAGTTSRVYKLTEEKWSEIDGQWKRLNGIVSASVEQKTPSSTTTSDSKQSTPEPVPVPMPHIPSADIVTGKFPVLGDEDIVGPMSVAPALKKFISNDNQLRYVKKRNFFKFISDLLAKSNARA